MMNYASNNMLRMFAEDAGTPELRTPELGKYYGKRKRTSPKNAGFISSVTAFARMSYEQLKRL